MDAEKVSAIIMEAAQKLTEAGCPCVHFYGVRVPGSTHEVQVIMFSDSQEACAQAMDTIKVAVK